MPDNPSADCLVKTSQSVSAIVINPRLAFVTGLCKDAAVVHAGEPVAGRLSTQSINDYLVSLTLSMTPCGLARRLCLHETKGRG